MLPLDSLGTRTLGQWSGEAVLSASVKCLSICSAVSCTDASSMQVGQAWLFEATRMGLATASSLHKMISSPLVICPYHGGCHPELHLWSSISMRISSNGYHIAYSQVPSLHQSWWAASNYIFYIKRVSGLRRFGGVVLCSLQCSAYRGRAGPDSPSINTVCRSVTRHP